MAGSVDAILLGMVGRLGTIRWAIYCSHLPWQNHSSINFRGDAHTARFTLAWLSLFGNTAISLVLEQGHAILGQVALADPPMAVYKLLEYLPWPTVTAVFTVIISFVLFLTPVDSGTLMIANLASKGGTSEDDAPIWLRLFWALVTTVLCAGLLYAGSFSAMQTAVVIAGLPFSVVILLYIMSLYRDLHRD